MERMSSMLLGDRIALPAGLSAGALPPDVVLRTGRFIPWLGGLLAGMKGSAAAVTLRRTIVVGPRTSLTPALLAHELAHVRQWRDDPLFPFRYSLAMLRHGYRNNPYEVEARQVEAATTRVQPGEETA